MGLFYLGLCNISLGENVKLNVFSFFKVIQVNRGIIYRVIGINGF